MPEPVCFSDPHTRFELRGWLRDYVGRVTEQWLLVAPQANPAMLEMFRDRDVAPWRDLLPWSGEFAGKYLTAGVQVLRLTGDARLRAQLAQFVAELVTCQADDGYLGPWPAAYRLTNRVPYLGEDGMLTWDTWGHYHVMLGLLLWHDFAGDPAALQTAARIGDLLCARYLGAVSPRLVDTGSTEMNLAPAHSLALLYRHVPAPRYLALAEQLVAEFAAEGPEGPLAGDYLRQGLAGKAFYEGPRPRWESLHPLMALAERYWLTGAEDGRQAFAQLWWSIAQHDRHNNGGFSSGEQATGNPFDPRPIETCCTVAWMALSVEMLKLSGDSRAADELELALFNSVTGLHSGSGRWATYNTPMDGQRFASAHHIVFQARAGSPELNCCSVNSPRGFGLLSEWALMRDADGLRLNYYGPGTLTAPLGAGAVTLEQATDYPRAGQITLTVTPTGPAEFTLRLRIPHWSARTSVRLNGTPVAGAAPGTYLALRRVWQPGDVLELELDLGLRVWPGEREAAGKAAFYRGPLLLAFDQRYNRHLALPAARVLPGDPFKPVADPLTPPTLDAAALHGQAAEWPGWLPPYLLLEVTSAAGETVRLCDFGSAGEGGSLYASWLPVVNAPGPVPFTRQNPLRSVPLG